MGSARGKRLARDVVNDDVRAREQIEYELAVRDVATRTRAVATTLDRVALWLCGKGREPLTDSDVRAIQEAARHFDRLATITERRLVK